jgi:hypothetical protein
MFMDPPIKVKCSMNIRSMENKYLFIEFYKEFLLKMIINCMKYLMKFIK